MKNKQPNILFIISDQHNAKCLGVSGHPDVKTPNLDTLAQEGVRFTNAITQNPICTPSRVSFFSGQYCHNHGYYGLGGRNPGGLPNILGYFREFGYTTAAIGKIHCPENWIERDCDYFREAYKPAPGKTLSDYAQYLAEKGLLEDRDDEFLQEYVAKRGKNSGQGLDARCSRLKYEDSVEGWCVKEARKFIETCGDKPFIMQVSLPRPHECYTPSEPFWSMYDEDKISLPPNADYDMSLKAPHFQKARKGFEKGEWTLFEPRAYLAGRRRVLRGYLGCVSQVDYAVGELLEILKEKGLEENTIVIYTSDHGDFAGEHGIIEKAPGITSDAITRIPFIWRWPGKCREGFISEQIVEAVDLAPTLISLAGLSPLSTCDGKDLTPLLQGEDKILHRVGVTECPFSKSIRKGKWRMVHYPPEMFGKEFGELYNLQEDPYEMKNLFFEREYQPLVNELRRELLNWLITTSRPITICPSPATGDAITRERNYPYQDDGKISLELIKKMIEDGNKNYL